MSRLLGYLFTHVCCVSVCAPCRWYLMALFKIARCYSKVYHSDPVVLNEFTKKAWQAYAKVVAKAEQWKADETMPTEIELCREMVKLLPIKMDRTVAKGSFQV